MPVEQQTGNFFSLAELAAFNTDEIEAIESRTPEPGVFRVKGISASMKQGEASDDGKPGLVRVAWVLEIVDGKPVDKSKDIEKLIGRKLTQSFTLWPDDIVELLGLLKGMYQKVGLPNNGILGGVEGKEPGWLDTVVNHEFDIRVRTAIVKSGDKRAFFDWLKPEEKKDEAAG